MKIQYSKRFVKEFKKCPKRVQSAFIKRSEFFIEDKNHPLLYNHKLSG